MREEETRNKLLEAISRVNDSSFSSIALRLFRYQAMYNKTYQSFLQLVNCERTQVETLSEVPFLPIETFKHHPIKTGDWKAEFVFQSSGTIKSLHHIRSLSQYHQLAIRVFEKRFGSLKQFTVLALLPHYLAAGHSSLVSMVQAFMKASNQSNEAFFLDDFNALSLAIDQTIKSGKRLLLFGVTYALLDFAEQFGAHLPEDTLLIETGGMKGRKEEWDRAKLHSFLKEQFRLKQIHSEYGMTELLSQAYTNENGFFQPPPTLQILVKELNDPMAMAENGKVGVIHLIDLANLDTCSFIATSDIGRNHGNAGFEVLGRVDNSDLRGCQLLYL